MLHQKIIKHGQDTQVWFINYTVNGYRNSIRGKKENRKVKHSSKILKNTFAKKLHSDYKQSLKLLENRK